jgi:hypothetical protein
MMAHVRPEKYLRSGAPFAVYTAKSPAYLRAQYLSHRKSSLKLKMKSAAKRTALQALAPMLDVTAMLGIAGFIHSR